MSKDNAAAIRRDRVTMLITAESIIAGFMIAYAALVSQMLFNWSTVKGASLFTTFQAGLLTSMVVLTCFQSIIFLYRSTESDDGNADFRTGQDLFIAAVLGTGIYVILNVVSLFHFSFLSSLNITPKPIATPNDLAFSLGELVVFFLYVFVLLHRPRCIQKMINCLTHGNGRNIVECFGWLCVFTAVILILLCADH